MLKDGQERLFTLEDWVRQIAELPEESLEQRFSTYENCELEIQSLPFFSRRRWQFRRLSVPLLETLAAKIRELNCEEAIWWGILPCLEHPLPEAVAHDLIERDIQVTLLAHTIQTEAIVWRLADLVDEALLTLLTIAQKLYSDNSHSVEEFEVILKKHPNHHWMLSSLAHSPVSSPEKSVLLEQFLMRHTDADRLMEIKRSVGDQQVAFSYDHLEKLPDWLTIPVNPSPEQLVELYGTKDPKELQALASDVKTTVEILEELTKITKIPGAVEIRRRANFNLRQRGFGAINE